MKMSQKNSARIITRNCVTSLNCIPAGVDQLKQIFSDNFYITHQSVKIINAIITKHGKRYATKICNKKDGIMIEEQHTFIYKNKVYEPIGRTCCTVNKKGLIVYVFIPFELRCDFDLNFYYRDIVYKKIRSMYKGKKVKESNSLDLVSPV